MPRDEGQRCEPWNCLNTATMTLQSAGYRAKAVRKCALPSIARASRLDLTAGAGLVKGSVVEPELQEVGLKPSVLADQFDLKTNLYAEQTILSLQQRSIPASVDMGPVEQVKTKTRINIILI